MVRDIAAEILEGLDDAAAYLDGRPSGVRVTRVSVPHPFDVRAVRKSVGITQAEFSSRYGIPLETLRKWGGAPGHLKSQRSNISALSRKNRR